MAVFKTRKTPNFASIRCRAKSLRLFVLSWRKGLSARLRRGPMHWWPRWEWRIGLRLTSPRRRRAISVVSGWGSVWGHTLRSSASFRLCIRPATNPNKTINNTSQQCAANFIYIYIYINIYIFKYIPSEQGQSHKRIISFGLSKIKY